MNKTFTLKVRFDPPPIPERGWDWHCFDDNTNDYDTPEGHGPSPLAAIVDFLRTLSGFEDIHLELFDLANKLAPIPHEDNHLRQETRDNP